MSNRYVYLDTTAQLSFETLQAKLLGELNVPRISMMYTDEEGDNVSIGSQEELDEAMTAAGGPNDLLCIRVYTQGGEAHVAQRGSGGHYSQLAQMNNAYLLEEINKSFNEALVVLSSIRGTPGSAPGVTGGDRELGRTTAHTHRVRTEDARGAEGRTQAEKAEEENGCRGGGQTEATPSNVEGTCAAPTYVEKTREELKEEIRRKTAGEEAAAHTARMSPHGLADALKHELKVLKMEKRRGRGRWPTAGPWGRDSRDGRGSIVRNWCSSG
eukprot:Em0012g773a